MKSHSFLRRLGFAVAGLREGWHRERSFRTQVFLGGFAVLVVAILRAQPLWWALVALAIASVLSAELFNSALEALVDRLHPEMHPEVRAIKDMAAAGILLLCLGALAVGLLLFVAVR